MTRYGGGGGMPGVRGESTGPREMRDGTLDANVVIRRVRRHFGELADDRANPLVVALALQDNSSVGLQLYADEFAELHRDLRGCLKEDVDDNYQGFTSSVGAYRGVVTGINDSHNLVMQTQEELKQVREELSRRKPGIRDLQHSSLRYKRMLDLLDVMEHLREVPALFEKQVAAKQFGQAHQILSEALGTINARNLLKVPAIQTIHRYIGSQQLSLYSMLVDELQAHLYLTSPYTDISWQHLMQQNQKQSHSQSSVVAEYNKFVDSLDSPVRLPTDHALIEQNSFVYIRTLLETLVALDSLTPALETIHSRISSEFRALHDRTVADIVRQAGLTPEQLVKIDSSKQGFLEELKVLDQGLLIRLADTLYAKLTVSLQVHCAISEVASRLNAEYDLKAVSRAVQNQLRSFLLEYVDASPGPHPRPRGRSFDSSSKFTKSKIDGPIFQFSSENEDPEVIQAYDSLRESLKKFVPGLLETASQAKKSLSSDSTNGDDLWSTPYADTSKETHLQVVARAHILNIRVLLEPTAAFLLNAKTILGDEQLDKFLDDFLQRTFVPRLHSAFERAFDEISEQPEALEVCPDWKSRSQLPIINAAASFIELLSLLCQILNTGQSFREEYTELLVDLLESIYQFFSKKMNDLMMLKRKVVYNIATSNELREKLEGLHEACQHDTAAAYDDLPYYWRRRHGTGNNSQDLVLGDLLDLENFSAISLLITSVQWTDSRLRAMRRVNSAEKVSIDSALDSSSSLSSNGSSVKSNVSKSLRQRWSLLDGSLLGQLKDSHPVAVLAGAQLSRFDNLIRALTDMSFRSLCVLRTDFMCRIVYYLDQIVIQGEFQRNKASRPHEARDVVVESLQRDIAISVRTADTHLTRGDRNFLLHGVARLMNELFILESENITDMNESSHDKMYTNIYALQQLLTSVISDPSEVNFSRAASFYDLLWLTPTLIIEKVREGTTDLTENDLKLLMRTKHRISGTSSSTSLASQLSEINEIFQSSQKSRRPDSQGTSTALVTKALPAPESTSDSQIAKPPMTTRASSNSLPRLDTRSHAAPKSPPRIRSATTEKIKALAFSPSAQPRSARIVESLSAGLIDSHGNRKLSTDNAPDVPNRSQRTKH